MKRLITSIGLVAIVSGCGIASRTHEVADVTRVEKIVLTKKPGQGYIHSLSIFGHGLIAGNAEISLILNGGAYKTEKLTGKVNLRWGGDWYSDQAEILYVPSSVTNGSLKLKYEFKD